MGHIAVYDAVVSLIQDLERYIKLYRDPEFRVMLSGETDDEDCAILTKADLKLLYQNIVYLQFGSGVRKIIASDPSDGWYSLLRKVTSDVRKFKFIREFKSERSIDDEASNSSPKEDWELVGHEEEGLFTGVCGIGKTILARLLYDHPSVVDHFDVRAWVPSSKRNPEAMFKRTVSYAKTFCTRLKGKRFLVVLDDLHDKKLLENWMMAFTDDNNGSRILLTSRLRKMCIRASLEVSLCHLTPDESWELFCSKIFPNESFPLEFIPLGKEIAYKCHGLPLVIILTAGFLSKVQLTLTVWEEVAEGLSSLVISSPIEFEYTGIGHLLGSFRTCFLRMELNPEFSGLGERMALEKVLEMNLLQIIAETSHIINELKNIYDHQQFLTKEPEVQVISLLKI